MFERCVPNVESNGHKSTKPSRLTAARSLVGLAMLLGIPVIGQQSPFSQFPAAGSGKLGPHAADNDIQFGQNATPDQKRVRLLNAERQRSIVSDSEKLLKLAQELNDEVAASDSRSMTDAEIRKVAEIGKLARSVKEKMSFSVGGFPAVAAPTKFPDQ